MRLAMRVLPLARARPYRRRRVDGVNELDGISIGEVVEALDADPLEAREDSWPTERAREHVDDPAGAVGPDGEEELTEAVDDLVVVAFAAELAGELGRPLRQVLDV
jgi:hypothetical protein